MRFIFLLFISLPFIASEPDFGKFDGTAVIVDLNTLLQNRA
ncbi:hypothetical protein [Sulfuricurvum sp.]|nr:hypothetical protein [Sulfuricurvum sp.]MDD2782221.1 hypothetical protein [Sulfuricurvum sp.]